MTIKNSFFGGIRLKKRFRLISLIGLAFIILFFTVILFFGQFAGVLLPLLVIFFFSLASEDISLDQVVMKRWISRDRTEEKGELIYVKLTVQNEGKRIPILEINDKIPEQCTVNEGSNHWLLELDQGEEITLSYAIRCHKRGRYAIGPVILRGSDIFQFRTEITEFDLFNYFSVVPSLIRLRHLPIYRKRLLPETGSIPSLTYKGRDFDFQGVRDYQEGDEMRVINWRVTAKFNKLAANEFALDQAARIFVVFDHTTSAKRVLEEGVMAALSTCEYLISQRNLVGFFAVGEFVEQIPAAPGKRQLLRINEYLIDTKGSYPSSDEVFSVRLNKKLLPSLPPFAQIFFISPLYNRSIANLLLELAKRDHEIILIVPCLESSIEEETLAPKASRLANALLSLDRAYTMKQVAQVGIMQIYWYPAGPKYEKIKVRRTR